MRGGGQVAIAFTTQQTPKTSEDGSAFTLTKDSPTGGGQQQCVAYQCQGTNVNEMGTLRAGNGNETGGVPFLPVSFQTSQSGVRIGETHPTLDSNNGSRRHNGVAFALRGREDGAVPEVYDDGQSVGALRAASGGSSRDYLASTAVRRLTPTECLRLQGFPDDHLDVPIIRTKHSKECDAAWDDELDDDIDQCVCGAVPKVTYPADGPKYRATGNSKAVVCVSWLGRRIDAIDRGLDPNESETQ